MSAREQRLAEIRERLAKATPGPWGWRYYDGFISMDAWPADESVEQVDVLRAAHESEHDGNGPFLHWIDVRKDDARFIAHSRADVEFLLSELEAAEERGRQADERCAHRFQRFRRWPINERFICWRCGLATRLYDGVDRMAGRPVHRHMTVAVKGFNVVPGKWEGYR